MKRVPNLSSAAIAVLSIWCSVAANAYEDTFYLAGRELSPGIGDDSKTFGVLFAGWTVEDEGWAPSSEGNGGSWMATIRREGEAGFGETVDIVGGRWSIQSYEDDTLRGRVLDGTVTWPSGPGNVLDFGDGLKCGEGVAQVTAVISLESPRGRPGEEAGQILGCLDDQKWLLEPRPSILLPPRIWGTLEIYSVPVPAR